MTTYCRRLFVAAALLAAVFAGAQEKLTIYGLKGPSGIGMIKLFESPPVVPGVSISTEALASADLMVARFATGEAKIGILPPNVAAKLAASGKPIAAVAVVGQGMLSLISADPSIRSIASLRGKEVYVAGQGATPDFVFRKILAFRGLKEGVDVSLRYSMAYPEMAQSLIAGRISVAVLPEPFATMALAGNKSLSVPVDLQAEWAIAGGSEHYPMTLLVVDTRYADANPQVISAILDAYRASVDWTVANPVAAGDLVEKLNLGLKASVAAAAIPKSAYVFVPAREARGDLEALFSAFLAFSPASIGGKLPDAAFYR